ncbi:MAG: transposase [Olsenella uli]|uniref:transposase n=1 Tax=Olsenella uli TaxID=133926 RepID=UPI001DD0250A|nr:transposase [Olsenella uli]MBS6418421.1 transposase [Olsenella uli]
MTKTYRIGPGTATQPVLDVDIEDSADHDHLMSYCGLVLRSRQSGALFNSVPATLQGNRQLKTC